MQDISCECCYLCFWGVVTRGNYLVFIVAQYISLILVFVGSNTRSFHESIKNADFCHTKYFIMLIYEGLFWKYLEILASYHSIYNDPYFSKEVTRKGHQQILVIFRAPSHACPAMSETVILLCLTFRKLLISLYHDSSK